MAEDATAEGGDVIPLFPMVDRPSTRREPESEPTPIPLRTAIGDVLREERHDQGRTLADVAEDAAVSLPYLSEVERGRKDVSSEILESIADALELPLDELLDRTADRLRIRAQTDFRPQLCAA